MALALALAARGLGQTWPNPSVGCVLVRAGRVLGRGWTAPGGRPHAETIALARAGEAARGATAYVTLEPCAHTGQTGPCAQALVSAGVARVVVAIGDPDPRVSGRGIAVLQAAGITVETGVLAAQARSVTAGFLSRVTRGRPCLTLKLATSLDGRIALASGASRWITGPRARAVVHALRAEHDAVMIGAGTARADDPMLDIRDHGPQPQQPVRIVTDAGLSLPLTGRLVSTARQQPLWLIHGPGVDPARRQALADLGVEMIEVPPGPTGQLDTGAALAALGARGLTRVLCEGGGQLAASLIRAGHVDDLVVFGAAKVIGADGIAGIGAMAARDLALVPRFRRTQIRELGPDLMIRYVPDTDTDTDTASAPAGR